MVAQRLISLAIHNTKTMQNTALALSKAYFNTKSFHITARIAILLGIAILITAYNKNLEVASAFMYKQCLVSKNDVF